MKYIQEKNKKIKTEFIKNYIVVIKQYVVLAYLFCMLGIFPLYYREQYYKIGDAKFDFFWKVSLCFIGITIIFVLLNFMVQRILYKFDCSLKKDVSFGKDVSIKSIEEDKNNSHNFLWKFLDNLSTLDYIVFIYAICVLLSYAFSDFKDYALKGAAGWEMGLCSQMIFVAIYFILSRQNVFYPKKKAFSMLILWIHLVSSSLVFVLGILHRFEIDPLGMYVGLELYHKVEFLSTIGQATWFSSYVCTTFAVGVTLFYMSEKRWIRTMTGIYSIISFGILVTQNSDSAFIAIAGIMLLLGYFSLSDMKKWCRFWEIMCLMWGTFGGIGILQKVFADRAIPLDSLSIFFSQSVITRIMLIISLAVMLFYRNCYNSGRKLLFGSRKGRIYEDCYNERNNRIMEVTKVIYKGFLVILAVGIVATIIFIYLNTKGYLLDWFGYQSMNQYLLFDNHWGNNRGSTWMVCWQAFVSLPWFRKLFGVGPDSLSAYLYSVPDISDFLHNLWGSTRVTNAHNEYLNSLLCYGMVGVISWLAVLIGGITYFYRKAKEKSFMIAFALCIMGYACHNIFCYQQVCCTPFLFIVLGIGESLTKSENFNTIK